MQRLQRRTSKAVAHATRQATLHNNRQARLDQFLQDRRNARHSQYRRSALLEAKEIRWEDWHMGPLAPVRPKHESDNKELPSGFLDNLGKGTSRLKSRTGKKQSGAKTVLRAKIGFKVGDRVCCVAMVGPAKMYRGMITTVREIRAAEKICLVERFNMSPTTRRDDDLDPDRPKQRHTTVPISSLVPVRTLHNPYTNTPEDVIVGLTPNQRTLARTPTVDPLDPFSTTSATRKRAQLDSQRQQLRAEKAEARQIKTERREERTAALEADNDIDTLRFEVESRTWTPSLLRAPMPGGVVDELRGKYSKFRTRHDPAYVQRLVDEERAKQEKAAKAREGGGMLLTPLRELSLRQRAEKAGANTKTDVPPASLMEQIGRRMVQRGAVSGPAADEGGVERTEQDTGVAAAQRDDHLRQQRRQGREQTARYWPVKGWREQGERRVPRDSPQEEAVE